MNKRLILFQIGSILILEAGLMLPSLGVALLHSEQSTTAFFFSILITAGAGLLLKLFPPQDRRFGSREGLVITGLAWILASLFGALPFYLSAQIPSYIDALFETVSGFTTTGSTILANIEVLDQGLLFWRSFTHWIGGMGILVFLLAILPQNNSHSMHLMRSEAPGPEVSKFVPRLRDSAKILYQIYILLTLIMVGCLLFAGMPLFDSLCTAFGTAGTGGFGIWNDSIAHYDSVLIEQIIAVFMVIFGINFSLYFFVVTGKLKNAFKNEEFHWFLGIILAAILMIAVNIMPLFDGFWTSWRHSSFAVTSIISTSGFATVDFNLWPTFSKIVLCLLMMVGSCAGSTGGGMKIVRIGILFKSLTRDLKKFINPRIIRRVRFNGLSIDEHVVAGIQSYFVIYMLIILASILLISLNGFDMTTTITSVLTTFNNVGPGLEMVGPTGNFYDFSGFSKLIFCLNMLLGRLEIYPLLFCFTLSAQKSTKFQSTF